MGQYVRTTTVFIIVQTHEVVIVMAGPTLMSGNIVFLRLVTGMVLSVSIDHFAYGP